MVTRTRETRVPVYGNGLRLPSMGRLGGRLSNEPFVGALIGSHQWEW
jgi:hypothetical protein